MGGWGRTLIAIKARRTVLGLREPQKAVLYPPSEDRLIRRLAPDYERLHQLLPHRTIFALRKRAGKLGARKRRPRWLISNKTFLANNRHLLSLSVMAKITGRSNKSVQNQLRVMGVPHGLATPRFVPANMLEVDICARLAAERISVAELCRRAKAMGGGSRIHKSVKANCFAVEVLGGELYVEWED